MIELLPIAAALTLGIVFGWRARALLLGRPFVAAALLIGAAPGVYVAGVWLGLWREAFVRIERPWLASASLGATLLVAHLIVGGGARTDRLRRQLGDLFLSIATLALAFIVMGLELGRPTDRLTVIVAVDRSRSVELVPNADELVRRELLLAEESMLETDQLAVVVFGSDATTEQPPRSKSEPRTAQEATVARDGTDLDAALRRALAEVPADSGARIVLVSDGVATRGDVMAGAAGALGAQVPIDVLPLVQEPRNEISIVSVRAPSNGDTGEAADLAIVTRASEETPVEVRVKRNGQLIRKGEVVLPKGEDVLRLREKLGDAGLHRYDVEITAKELGADLTPEDNAGAAFVRVRGRASALILEGDGPAAAAFVANVLEKADFRVEVAGAAAVPSDLAGFAAFDLVILSDVPASALATSQIDALAAYVRETGGGLLILGGDRGLGPGGFGKTPLEEVSPVSFDLKQDQRRASLSQVIGIDISGSMAAQVAGKTKLELANDAAARSAELLGLNDRLGVEHVDTEVYWTVPLSPVVNPEAIGTAIRSMPVGGGGILVPITLREGYAALRQERTNIKHLLLFADGSDAEQMDEAKPLTVAALSEGITTSVVALGQGQDVPALEEMSRLGKGRFYLIEDAGRLPAVFAQETILAARSALFEEPFDVSLKSPGAVAGGIDFEQAPQLLGYVVTLPKSRASIHLTGPEGDPILATWSVGVGRAGVFASDLKGRWGSAWTDWSGAARLLIQLARDLVRRADDDKVRSSATISDGRLQVQAAVLDAKGRASSFQRLQAKLLGPEGFERTLPLEASGAGTYLGNVPVEKTGSYVVLVSNSTTGELLSTTGAVMSRGEELRLTGSDLGALGRVADFTGGLSRASLEGVFELRPRTRHAYQDVSDALAILAAASVLALVASRKLGIPEAWVDAWRTFRSASHTLAPASAPATRAPAATLAALRSIKTRPGSPEALRSPPPQAPPAAPTASGAGLPPKGSATAAAVRKPAPDARSAPDPRPAPNPRPAPAPPAATPPPATPPPGGKAPTTAELLAAKKRGNRPR